MFHCHGFVMVRDVSLSWFRHGSSWFVMFHCHGFVMVHDVSLSWFRHGYVMVRDVLFSKILQKVM